MYQRIDNREYSNMNGHNRVIHNLPKSGNIFGGTTHFIVKVPASTLTVV